MKYRNLLYFSFLVVFINAQIAAQTNADSRLVGAKELYDLVLESVFPRTVLENQAGFGLILRFRPSFKAESQISIEKKGATFTVTEYRVVGDSVYARIGEIDPVSTSRIESMASEIPIRVKVITVTKRQLENWLREFYGIFSRSLHAEGKYHSKNPNAIFQIDDGTRYEIWYRGRFQLSYRRQGTDLYHSSPTEDPVINWMKRVSIAVGKQSQSSFGSKKH